VASPWSIWYPVLDTVADSVNPLLAFFAIVAAIREGRSASRHIGVAFAIAAALGLAGIYTVRALVKLSIWHALGGHYSTHAAFATSIVISLAFWLPRRRVVLVTILLAYEVLMLIMGYHSVADVLTGSVVACVVTVPWHLAARSITLRRGGPERSAASASRASDDLSE
jgi:membrane-associated phospholipid phosphatase